MTLIAPSDDTEPTALAPDPDRLDPRSRRAWTERMVVDRRGDDSYAVTTESGHTYRVDLIKGEWPEDPTALGRLCDNRYDFFGGSKGTPAPDQKTTFVTCYVD